MALQDDCETHLWSLIMKSEGTLDTEKTENSSFCFSEEDFHGSTISAVTLEEDGYPAPSPAVERKWASESKVKDTLRPPSKNGVNRFSSCSEVGDATPCQLPKRKLSVDLAFSGPLLDSDSLSDCDSLSSFSTSDDEESYYSEENYLVGSKYYIEEAASIDASRSLHDLFEP